MDFYRIAQMDWKYYQDPARIAVYVRENKITPAQYQEITGLEYSA